jgi:hypothetical protein
MRRRPVERRIRAQFKETARRIIGDDRAAKRHGSSQNTIGSIERALVDAYVLGRESDARDEPLIKQEAPGLIDWIEIPPRSRETLSSMTFRFSSRYGEPDFRPSRFERSFDEGRWRWTIVSGEGLRRERTIADGSVAPLIRSGLLRPSSADPDLFELTDLGVVTCREFWRRSDRDDPTLPRISLRR